MQAIFMKHRPKPNDGHRRGADALTKHNPRPLVYLNPENQYSVSPCSKNCKTVVAYSKGKMSGVPDKCR